MISIESVKNSILSSFRSAQVQPAPYRHYILNDVLPPETLPGLRSLPFTPPDLEGVSGSREVHNNSRNYFDVANRREFAVCDAICSALQDPEIVAAVQSVFGADLEDTFLRVEYAQDCEGFWLRPHTDIGVKRFTMLLYLSDDPGHETLGTSIYADPDQYIGDSPFAPNAALVFVPTDSTWHGFERRPIPGVRKSIIINYVTQEWRAREQLAFPDQTVRAA